MKREFQYPSRDGVTQIHAIEWEPEGEIHAVMQLCHGMVEFIDRYDAFAKYLNEHGIYVVGHDHLGHGKSVQNEEYHGYFHKTNGNEYVIGDIHKLREMTQKKYPDKPYFMYGVFPDPSVYGNVRTWAFWSHSHGNRSTAWSRIIFWKITVQSHCRI